jgi:hypothetical protein
MLHPASHAGRGDTLGESCCRTCRRLRTKYRRRQTVTFTHPTSSDRGRPASDPGAAARAEAEPMGRSAAPQLVTVTMRSPQLPPRPPSDRRRAGRDPPMNGTHRGTTASDPGAAARAEAEPTERPAAPQLATEARRSPRPPPCPAPERTSLREGDHFRPFLHSPDVLEEEGSRPRRCTRHLAGGRDKEERNHATPAARGPRRLGRGHLPLWAGTSDRTAFLLCAAWLLSEDLTVLLLCGPGDT